MTARVLLVCHGSTKALRTAAFPADEPLDEAGAASAKAAAARLRLAGSDQACCAPSVAARQTATALGLDPSIEPALRDCDFGRWRGQLFMALAEHDPDAIAEWLADPTAAPHGGESVVDLVSRVGRWLAARRGHPGRIVAITHPAVIRAAVVAAIDATPASFWRIDIAPLSHTELRCHQQRWNLHALGRSDAFEGLQ